MSKLKSPTCRDCAWRRDLIPVTDVYTVYEGECANCKRITIVSSASDWKRRGEQRHGFD